MGYILLFLGLICMSGCSTTSGNYTEFSKTPFVETPVTAELLHSIPDLDQEPITLLLFIVSLIEQDKENLVKSFHN